MDLGLSGKVAVVTGGASGIGEAIARTLAAEGARVSIVDRDSERAVQIVNELNQSSSAASHFVETDLSDLEACERAVSQTIRELGQLDIVINNAGVNDSVGLDAGPVKFEASLRRNLTHYYAIIHYAAEQLRANRGAIVNVTSKVSVTGQGGTSGYAAAKGAINALTREWAADFATQGVRVNAVVPAEVWTPMYEQWLGSLDDAEAVKSDIANSIPLERRFTTADEMARMAVFLASNAASHVTGQIIYIDGGYTHLDRRLTL